MPLLSVQAVLRIRTVNIVAIHKLGKDKETLAGALATVLSVSSYDALMRLRIPGNGPLTVGVFAEKKRAEELGAKLQSAGFAALILTDADIEAAAVTRVVRRFALGEREIRMATDEGNDVAVSLQDVDLILCGMRISRSTETETVKKPLNKPGTCSAFRRHDAHEDHKDNQRGSHRGKGKVC